MVVRCHIPRGPCFIQITALAELYALDGQVCRAGRHYEGRRPYLCPVGRLLRLYHPAGLGFPIDLYELGD